VRRATFPELYQLPKITFGAFKGVAVDDGSVGSFLTVSDSVRLTIRWVLLGHVENRALRKARQLLADEDRYLPELSARFSEWYLCALALSEPIQQWLHANKRSMKEHVYPDDIKAIPVKRLSPKKQEPFIRLEKERHGLWRELIALEDEGFKIGRRIEVPVHRLAVRFREERPEVEHLDLFKIPRSLFEIEEAFYDRDLRAAKASGSEVLVQREVALRVGEAVSAKAEVAKLLARYLGDMPGTWAGRQTIDALPRTEAGLLALSAWLDAQEEGVRRRQARIEEIQAEIDRRAWELYRP
jgi:hypothetical protein